MKKGDTFFRLPHLLPLCVSYKQIKKNTAFKSSSQNMLSSNCFVNLAPGLDHTGSGLAHHVGEHGHKDQAGHRQSSQPR